MPALFPLPLAAWPLTLGAAFVVLGVSSQGTLNLISEHVHQPTAVATTKRSDVIIKMPAPVAVGMHQAETRLAAINAGRSISGGAATLTSSIETSVPVMQVTTPALIIRSHPTKTSAQVGVLRQGDVVDVRAKQGGWVLVQSAHGAVGWVFHKYLALKPAAPGSAFNSPSAKGTVS